MTNRLFALICRTHVWRRATCFSFFFFDGSYLMKEHVFVVCLPIFDFFGDKINISMTRKIIFFLSTRSTCFNSLISLIQLVESKWHFNVRVVDHIHSWHNAIRRRFEKILLPRSAQTRSCIADPNSNLQYRHNRTVESRQDVRAIWHYQSLTTRKVPLNDTFAARAQVGSTREDLSPATPSSASSASGSSEVYAFEGAGGHHALMSQWRHQKCYEVQKKEKHRYVYGQPPPVERSGRHGTLQSRLIAATQPRHDPPAPTQPSPAETHARVQPSEKRLSTVSTDV